MKIETQTKTFDPITVTIETHAEAELLAHLIGQSSSDSDKAFLSNRDYSDTVAQAAAESVFDLYNTLTDALIS